MSMSLRQLDEFEHRFWWRTSPNCWKDALPAKKTAKKAHFKRWRNIQWEFLTETSFNCSIVSVFTPSMAAWMSEERQATIANSAIMTPSRFRSMGFVIFAIKLKRAMIAKENKIQKSPRSWQENQNKQNLDSPSTATYTYCWQRSIHCLIDKFAV